MVNFTELNGSGNLTPWATANTAALVIGTDFDLNKLLGMPGATIHVEETIFGLGVNQGVTHNFHSSVGSYAAGAPMPNNTGADYLSTLSYEQHALANRLEFEVGRLNPVRAFNQFNCDNLLTCQNPISQFTANMPPPPFSSWGSRLKYTVAPPYFVQLGAYEDHISNAMKTDGFNFSTNAATGALLLLEVGRQTNFAQSHYPSTYTMVAFRDTSRQTDPANRSLHEAGTGGYVFQAQQVLWRADDGVARSTPAHYFAGFTTLAFTPDHYAPFSSYADLGVNYYGIFSNRPQDHIGLKATYIQDSTNELIYQENSRVAAGGPKVKTSPNQMRFELSATFDIWHGITFQPSIQYDVNPDTWYNVKVAKVPTDGFVFGTVINIPLGNLLGLSRPNSPL